MKRFITTAFAAFGLIIIAARADASIQVVDADAYAAGTILNGGFAGVTLTALGSGINAPTSTNVFSRTSGLASTGLRVFGYAGNFDPLWLQGSQDLRIDILAQTDWVGVDVIANDTDSGRIRAFSSADVLLATADSGVLSGGQSQFLSIQRGSADIAYVMISGIGGDDVAIDNFQYNSRVPEPGTVVIWSVLGLAGLGIRRRNSQVA